MLKKSITIIVALMLTVPVSVVAASHWFDTYPAERNASGYPISNRADVDWAYANKGAEAICHSRGYSAGLYTGHQAGTKMGIHCMTSDVVQWFNVPDSELFNAISWTKFGIDKAAPPGEHFYLPANTSAHWLCRSRGYGTGFFNGHQARPPGLTGLYCIPEEKVFSYTFFDSYFLDAAPWHVLAPMATDFCQSKGHRAGIVSITWITGTFQVRGYGVSCWN